MYNEVNTINTDYHKITINGIERTQQEWIDELIRLCELYLKDDIDNWIKYSKEIWEIWSELSACMWW